MTKSPISDMLPLLCRDRSPVTSPSAHIPLNLWTGRTWSATRSREYTKGVERAKARGSPNRSPPGDLSRYRGVRIVLAWYHVHCTSLFSASPRLVSGPRLAISLLQAQDYPIRSLLIK